MKFGTLPGFANKLGNVPQFQSKMRKWVLKVLVNTISREGVKRWGELLREKLLDPTSGFPKEYLAGK